MPQDEKKDAPVAQEAPEVKDASPAPKKAKKRGPGRTRKAAKAKHVPSRPKGRKNRRKAAKAPKKAAKGRGGRPTSIKKAVIAAYKSGIRLYGAIAGAVKKATGQSIRFPAIAMALKGVRSEKAAKPPKKAKRGPGRPRGTGRGRGRPAKATAGAAEFFIVMGRKITKAGSAADVKARLARILSKADSLGGVEVYERRKVKIERKVTVTL